MARIEDDVELKRLQGSSIIPPLEAGVQEESVKSKDWIIRRALGSRPGIVGSDAFDITKSRGTEELSLRY